MPDDQPWTVGRLLGWTTDYLGTRGSETARLDAEVLLAEALECQRIELYTTYHEVPGEDILASFRQLVTRRAAGEPVAYLVGRREFYSLSFHVTPDVLVPRPETEFLVMALVDLAKQRPPGSQLTVCDVGTGSGVIAVCAAKHLADCRVTAVDISPAALEVARRNVSEHDVGDRVELIESDLLAAIPVERRFDFIVGNPPYVSRAEMETLAPDVRQFEPCEALVAGDRGTEVIEALLPQAAARLDPGGYLLLEISPMVHDDVRALIRADGRFRLDPTIQDLARLPRVIQAEKE